MRVANRTIYDLTTYRLQNRTEDLFKANNVISSGKSINSLSDNPVGLTQVMKLKSSIINMEQLNENISNGKMWLNAGETSLASAKDIILDMRTMALAMSNDSVNSSQRSDAVEQVDAAIRQLMSLGNTVVNGQHIFGGTITDTAPLIADNRTSPTKVTYTGDDIPFAVKLEQIVDAEVGRVGKEIFWEDYIKVDSTNNKINFSEDIGKGHEIRNVLATGSINTENITITTIDKSVLVYGTPPSTDQTAATVLNNDYPPGPFPLKFTWDLANNVWNVEDDPGYNLSETIAGTADKIDIDFNDDLITDMTIELSKSAEDEDTIVFDLFRKEIELSATLTEGTYTASELATAAANTMTDASLKDGYKVTYDVRYDEDTKKFAIRDNGLYSGYFSFNTLWSTGDNVGDSISPDMGFEVLDDSMIPITSDQTVTQITIDNTNRFIDFRENDGTGWSAELGARIALGSYSEDEFANVVREALEESSFYDADYEVDFTRQVTGFVSSWVGGPAAATVNDADALTISTPAPPGTAPLIFTWDNTNGNWQVQNDPGYGLPSTITGTSSLLQVDLNDDGTTDISVTAAVAASDGDTIQFDLVPMYNIDGSEDLTGFELLWFSGRNTASSAAATLGYDNAVLADDDTGALTYLGDNAIRNITITDGVNNIINYKEFPQGGRLSQELTAEIPAGSYTATDLAVVIKEQLESQSRYNINYDVTYDTLTYKFTIKEMGTTLDELHILWENGIDGPNGTDTSIASVIGFDEIDEIVTPINSDEETEWGLFKTLVDLKEYLQNNDVEGLNRTISRLDTHYDHMLSTISDNGHKENRLLTREMIISELKFVYTERQTTLEDADYIEAISNLQSNELAYEASLASSAKIMRLSLVDYI